MQEISTLPALPTRPQDSHKGDFGKILVVAGSRGMAGAAALAGRAGLRCGAGLVRVATPTGCLSTVAGLNPCYTTLALPEDRQGRISFQSLNLLLDAVDREVMRHELVAQLFGVLHSRHRQLLGDRQRGPHGRCRETQHK